jgi:hypothetical protein
MAAYPVNGLELDFIDFPLKWSGEYIGTLSDSDIVSKKKVGRKTYWMVNFCGLKYLCNVRQTNTSEAAIADEMKVLFKIIRLGTVRCKYKSKYYTLINVRSTEELSTTPKTKENPSKSYINSVRRNIVFRYVIGSKIMSDNDLVEISEGDLEYVTSYRDSSLKPFAEERYVIPDTVKNRWFKDKSMTVFASEMFGVDDNSDLIYTVSWFRKECRSIIERVDEELVYLISFICERLSNLLQYEITDVSSEYST